MIDGNGSFTGLTGVRGADPARLGLVLDQVLYRCDGRYSTDEAFIRFIEHVSRPLFDRIEFCSRACRTAQDAPYHLDPSYFDIVALPWYENMTSLCLRGAVLFPRIARSLDRPMRGWELVIVGNLNPLAPLVLRMARRRGVPAILWVRGDLLHDLEHRMGDPIRRLAGRLAAAAVIRSIPKKTHIISSGDNHYPFLSRMGPVQVVYSSKFDDSDFAPLPRRRLDSHRPRLLYVGRIAPEKGLEVLLDALRVLAREGDASTRPSLTLVGADLSGGGYGNDFRRRLESSDLVEDVRMAGYVPYGKALFEIYDAHDIVVLPSFTEGFPQVLLEAMVRGLPVVSTAVGGIPKIVRDGENGLLVPAGDAVSLARSLRRISSDPRLTERLTRSGQESARPFTRHAQMRVIERFIRQSFPRVRLKMRPGCPS